MAVRRWGSEDGKEMKERRREAIRGVEAEVRLVMLEIVQVERATTARGGRRRRAIGSSEVVWQSL